MNNGTLAWRGFGNPLPYSTALAEPITEGRGGKRRSMPTSGSSQPGGAGSAASFLWLQEAAPGPLAKEGSYLEAGPLSNHARQSPGPALVPAAPPRGAFPQQRGESFPRVWLLLPPLPDCCGARGSGVLSALSAPKAGAGPNSRPTQGAALGTPAERAATARVPFRPTRSPSSVTRGQVSEGPRPA